MYETDWTKGLLPVGSVVEIPGGPGLLMIAGYMQTGMDGEGLADYVGVAFPEGYQGGGMMFHFNREDVSEVWHIGYSDDAGESFRETAQSLLERLRSGDIEAAEAGPALLAAAGIPLP